MLTWWLWVDRHSGNWVIAQAGETVPKLKAKHVKIRVPSETVVFDKSKKVRWVIQASGFLRNEGTSVVIDDELQGRLAELERVAHPPVAQDDIAKLARRISELEKMSPRGNRVGDTATWNGTEWVLSSKPKT